ncbi:MAG: hypothetical protein IKZ82_02530 [Clostridia bacterium]|nr:hypothetical protein [Clostridia bacterium]
MNDITRRVIKVLGVIAACAGLLTVILSLLLLAFGSKTVGTYAETVSVHGAYYTYLYDYTVDGQRYGYVATRRFTHGEGEHSTQKISYLSFAPTVTYTPDKTAVGAVTAAVGVLGFFLADIDKNKPAAKRKSPQWNSYLNKVRSGGNKRE